MDKKLPNGRYTPEFRDHVVEWTQAQPGRGPTDAMRHFGVGERSVRRWMHVAGVGPLAETFSPDTTPPPPPRRRSRAKSGGPPGGRYRAPVEDLGLEDKERALRSVRSIAEIVDIGTSVMLERIQRARALWDQAGAAAELDDARMMAALLSLSKDDAQAMLHLTRTQGLMIDNHPGILKLAGVKDQAETNDQKLAQIAQAMGIKVPGSSGSDSGGPAG